MESDYDKFKHFQIQMPNNAVEIQEIVDKQNKDFVEFSAWLSEMRIKGTKLNMDPLALRKAMIYHLHLQTEAAILAGISLTQLAAFDAHCGRFSKNEVANQRNVVS